MGSIGIELGSTRIKSVLIDRKGDILSTGIYDWENKYENGLWTYSVEDIQKGVRGCINDLFTHCKVQYEIENMGVSGMMHGYIVLDKNGNMLVPFRTWRNVNGAEAAKKLSEVFGFNIPVRWSIAHLYQAILNNEPHVKDIAYLTTLSGYIHYLLTGEKVLGIGDASGVFPLDYATGDYDEKMLEAFDNFIKDRKYPWKIREILPKIIVAGRVAGRLTKTGEEYLNCKQLKKGLTFCPPEGDAGTGMVATNGIKKGYANLSAGTSAFVMVVLKKKLSKSYGEIDIVATPDGLPVAMVHCNNCTSDINAWAALFKEVLRLFGKETDTGTIFEKLFNVSLEGRKDFGKLVSFNFVSGEPLVGLNEGKSTFIRRADSSLTLPNFMKTQIYGALIALRYGMRILWEEGVKIENTHAHGGFFKGGSIAAKAASAVLKTPITLMKNAGEGGAWGMALLASYLNSELDLASYLENIFSRYESAVYRSSEEDLTELDEYLKLYDRYLKAEMKR